MTENIVWHEGAVTGAQRATVTGGRGMTIWMTGLSGSGKSTIARLVEAELIARGRAAYVLDGDNLRHGLNSDLGFSPDDRTENVRRVGEVAGLLADAGLVTLVPVIAPYEADRERVRRDHDSRGSTFMEVFVDAPLEVCRERDPKGLYARAAAGEITGMTGVDAPYEAPTSPDLHLDSAGETAEMSASAIVDAIFNDLDFNP